MADVGAWAPRDLAAEGMNVGISSRWEPTDLAVYDDGVDEVPTREPNDFAAHGMGVDVSIASEYNCLVVKFSTLGWQGILK